MDSSIDNQQEQGNQAPRVSIIMPVYNGASSVARAMASVARQSFGDYEFVVIDDGSTDDTKNIVLQAAEVDSRIVYERNEVNQGVQVSLNRGLELAKGKYIARIDCDDQWAGNDKLEQQVRFMEDNGDHVLLGTGAVVVDENEKILFRVSRPLTDQAIRKEILGKNCFLHGSILARTDAMRQAGGYDSSPACRHVEDYDLWLRLGQLGKMANLPAFVLQYTVSPSQISAQNRKEQFKKNVLLMKKYKNAYPGYFRAFLRNYSRLFLYGYCGLGDVRKIRAVVSS